MSDEPRFCPLCGTNMKARTCPTDGVPTLRSDYLPAGDDDDPVVGRVFSERYEIKRVLGEGGFGRVYVAVQLAMARKVALKTLHPHLITNRGHLARFYHEARSVSRLTGPHVVRVFDFGVDEDTRTPFLAMELLRGQTMSGLLRSEAPVEPRRAAKILGQVARALAEAEEVGLVHRDLKPDNAFMVRTATSDDFVKVMDFGLAKVLRDEDGAPQSLTSTGVVIGTPRYMAPEQVLGKAVDTRTDLYALGCILHEMLTGQPTFTGKDHVDLLVQHATRPAPPLSNPLPGGAHLPGAMAELHGALLEKSADDRPPTARVVVDALDAIGEGRDVNVAAMMRAASATRKPSEEELRPTFDLSMPTAASEPPSSPPEHVTESEAPATRKVVGEAQAPEKDDEKPTVPQLDSQGPSSMISDFHPSQLGWRSGLLAFRLRPWRFGAVVAAVVLLAGAAYVGVLAEPETQSHAGAQAPSLGDLKAPKAPEAPVVDVAPEDTAPPTPGTEPPTVTPPTPPTRTGSSGVDKNPGKARRAGKPPAPAVLVIESSPKGAAVYLGRKRLCARTPCRAEVAAAKGKTKLVFKMAGRIDSHVEVELAGGEVTRVHTMLVKAIDDLDL